MSLQGVFWCVCFFCVGAASCIRRQYRTELEVVVGSCVYMCVCVCVWLRVQSISHKQLAPHFYKPSNDRMRISLWVFKKGKQTKHGFKIVIKWGITNAWTQWYRCVCEPPQPFTVTVKYRPVRGLAESTSGKLFVASCGAIKGPSADNRLCLKGTHSLVPVLPHCVCVWMRIWKYHAFPCPILIYYKAAQPLLNANHFKCLDWTW